MTTKRAGQWMAEEMAEQPEVLRRLAARRPGVQRAVLGLRPDGLRGVTLVARGSSDNAAIFGRYVTELVLPDAPGGGDIATAVSQARQHQLVVVGTSGAHAVREQAELVGALLNTQLPLVTVAVRTRGTSPPTPRLERTCAPTGSTPRHCGRSPMRW